MALIKEEAMMLAIAHKYNLEVYKQIVVNSIAVDYTIESDTTDLKIAILKRTDLNAKEALELSDYKVLQANKIDFNTLENIIKVFSASAKPLIARKKQTERPFELNMPRYATRDTAARAEKETEDNAYWEGSPSNWRHRNTKPYAPEANTPKYAVNREERQSFRRTEVYEETERQSVPKITIILAVLSVLITLLCNYCKAPIA